MVTAVILSGGIGVRMGANCPKQYIIVKEKPILWYCLRIFEYHPLIDQIVIVADSGWQNYVDNVVDDLGMKKFIGFANAGSSRQQSVYNGLLKVSNSGVDEKDIVVIHDAARPCVSNQLISNCVNMLDQADGAMPVLPVKDTVYQSKDGVCISTLLNRDEVFAGQAPESFRLWKYLAAHDGLSEKELTLIRGSSEIAFKAGMKIRMFNGEESNYKITTPADLEKFRQQMNHKEE